MRSFLLSALALAGCTDVEPIAVSPQPLPESAAIGADPTHPVGSEELAVSELYLSCDWEAWWLHVRTTRPGLAVLYELEGQTTRAYPMALWGGGPPIPADYEANLLIVPEGRYDGALWATSEPCRDLLGLTHTIRVWESDGTLADCVTFGADAESSAACRGWQDGWWTVTTAP